MRATTDLSVTQPPLRILLIDDDRIQARLLSLRLESQGYTILVSHDGAAGLELARRSKPSLILCDWMMQGMDGLEVCRRVKGDPELAATYFILLTSRSDLEDRIEGLDAGADDFLSKPVAAEELLARVRSGLRLYQATLKLTDLTHDLQRQQAALQVELTEAAAYVASQLPPSMHGSLRVDARFRPSLQLGGDGYDYFWIDEDHLLIHMIDVSGHGLAAALPSISVLNRVRSRSLGVDLTRPELVLEALNRDFQMEQHHDRYFTIWCGVYGRCSRELRYCSAGHPPAVLLPPPTGSGRISTLSTRGMAIGLFAEAAYRSESCTIEAGSTLLVMSDGIYEVPAGNGAMGSLDVFIAQLSPEQLRDDEALDQLMSAGCAHTGTGCFSDDVSLLRVRFS